MSDHPKATPIFHPSHTLSTLTKAVTQTPGERASETVSDALSQVIEARRKENAAKKPPATKGANTRAAAAAAISEAEVRYARNPHAQAQAHELNAQAMAAAQRKAFDAMMNAGGFPVRARHAAERVAVESFGGGEDLVLRLMVRLEQGGIVVLLGPNGVGKTVLATMVAMAWIKARGAESPARYEDAALYVAQMRHDCYSARSTSEKEWIKDEVKRTGLLVLDELDKMAELEKTTPSTFILERIVKARHDRMDRPTVLIANYTTEAFEQKVPASIRDRAAQSGKPIEITGESWRRIAPKSTPTRSPQ